MEISGYERGPVIGEGGRSEVWLGSYSGRKVAIKVLMSYQGDEDTRKKEIRMVGYLTTLWWQQCIDVTPHLMQGFFKEVVTWKNLDHQNLLPLVGANVESENGTWKYEIISEFMANGTINTFILQNQGVNRFELVGFD